MCKGLGKERWDRERYKVGGWWGLVWGEDFEEWGKYEKGREGFRG